MMNKHAPQKVMVRRANKALEKTAQHWTIQHITTTTISGKAYGFAIADDGETKAYIPAPIVKRHKMTVGDEGAGFTAPTRPAAAAAGDDAFPQIINPVVWDGGAEYVAPEEVGLPEAIEPGGPTHDEVDRLLERLDAVGKLVESVDKMLEQSETRHNHLHHILRAVQSEIQRNGDTRDALNVMHNDLTRITEWLEKEYPDE